MDRGRLQHLRIKGGAFIDLKAPHQWRCWGVVEVGPRKQGTVTSSTAQGGGGSFKNRKPIGELGCCESEMAERSH